MDFPLSVRIIVIGIGALLLVATPYVHRWEKRPSEDYSPYRQIRMQIFPGWAACIILGVLFVLIGALA